MRTFCYDWKKCKGKRKGVDLYSALLWNSSLKRPGWHVLKGSHSFICHPHVYTRMEMAILTLLPAAEHHCILAGIHFPSHRGQEAGLACVAGYIPRWHARPKTVTNPSTNRLIVWRPGIELTTIESQSDALTTRLPSHLGSLVVRASELSTAACDWHLMHTVVVLLWVRFITWISSFSMSTSRCGSDMSISSCHSSLIASSRMTPSTCRPTSASRYRQGELTSQ